MILLVVLLDVQQQHVCVPFRFQVYLVHPSMDVELPPQLQLLPFRIISPTCVVFLLLVSGSKDGG
jgi:hypothetical protein